MRCLRLAPLVLLLLAACQNGDAATPGATPSLAAYTTSSFVVRLSVVMPDGLPQQPTVEEPNFVTWETTKSTPKIRFLVPVNVYRPGDTAPSAPPKDYLAYLLGQADAGARFAARTETSVDGRPATLVTATTEHALDGSLGCPASGVSAPDCFGLQPDLALRLAVIKDGSVTLLAWVRADLDTARQAQQFADFERMLSTVRFV